MIKKKALYNNNHSCMYTGKLEKYAEFVIDHIQPRSRFDSEKALRETLPVHEQEQVPAL